MLFKLTRVVSSSHQCRYKLYFFSRCFISQNVTRLNKKSNLPVKDGKDKVPEALIQVTKTIEARPVVPNKATQRIEYLEKLSDKSSYLAKYLIIPM